MAKTQEKRRAR